MMNPSENVTKTEPAAACYFWTVINKLGWINSQEMHWAGAPEAVRLLWMADDRLYLSVPAYVCIYTQPFDLCK